MTRPKARIPLWRWALWWLILVAALGIFYVVLTPLWMGLRALAWLAELDLRHAAGYCVPPRRLSISLNALKASS